MNSYSHLGVNQGQTPSRLFASDPLEFSPHVRPAAVTGIWSSLVVSFPISATQGIEHLEGHAMAQLQGG